MKIDNLDIQDKIIQPGGVVVFCVKTSLEKLKLKMINIKIEYERTWDILKFCRKKMKNNKLDIQDKVIQPGGVALFCLKTSLASSSLIHQHDPPLPPASLFKDLHPNNSFRGKSICIHAHELSIFNIHAHEHLICIVIQ